MPKCRACDSECRDEFCEKCSNSIRIYNSDYTGEGESSDRVLDQELIEEFLSERFSKDRDHLD